MRFSTAFSDSFSAISSDFIVRFYTVEIKHEWRLLAASGDERSQPLEAASSPTQRWKHAAQHVNFKDVLMHQASSRMEPCQN